jgi:hypothetical protein
MLFAIFVPRFLLDNIQAKDLSGAISAVMSRFKRAFAFAFAFASLRVHSSAALGMTEKDCTN